MGTAFFVAEGYLLTCRHVVEGIPDAEIFLQSDTGAWPEGGLRRIQPHVPHPTADVALLPLAKPVSGARCILLAQPHLADLEQGESVRLFGYTTAAGAVEIVEVEVSAYLGDYDLELTHTPIGKGMSGGPVFRGDELVGITRLKDDVHTYIIRANTFRSFLDDLPDPSLYAYRRSIPPDRLGRLKDLFASTELPDEEKIVNAFRKVAPRLAGRLRTNTGNVLFDALDLLADTPHREPDQAPMLEFLMTLSLPQTQEFADWQRETAEGLRLDLRRIRARAEASEAEAQAQPIAPPVLLVKLEPDQLIRTDLFRVRAWLYLKGKPSPLRQDNCTYSVDQLERLLPELLSQVRRRLTSEEAKDLLAELIIPLSLWHWNLSRIPARAGPLEQPLGELYALAVRSWERIYHQDYDSIRYQWEDKWQVCCSAALASPLDRLHCEQDSDPDCVALYDQLQGQYLIFMALFPVTAMPQGLSTLFGTVLASGVPFALWPLCRFADSALLPDSVRALFGAADHRRWPRVLQDKRKNEKGSWHDLQLLWDNPERIPPDVNYRLLPPE